MRRNNGNLSVLLGGYTPAERLAVPIYISSHLRFT
jgi:hypothetical protein